MDDIKEHIQELHFVFYDLFACCVCALWEKNQDGWLFFLMYYLPKVLLLSSASLIGPILCKCVFDGLFFWFLGPDFNPIAIHNFYDNLGFLGPVAPKPLKATKPGQ